MLILASASPRRQELLRNADIPFLVQPSHILETHLPHESPLGYVRRLAREKALAVAGQTSSAAPILAADTEVVLNVESGAPLGKPRDAVDAARMLKLLSGRSHHVITGVCLMWKDG